MIEKFYKRGENHEHHNEDAMFTTSLSKHISLIAVMDGCSTGEESHFASALFSKLLKKIAKNLPDQTDIHGEELLKSYSLFSLGMHITRSFFVQLQNVQQHLDLSYSELASTLIVAIINTRTKQIWYLMAGDGCIITDNKIEEFDQNNYPNFICYHLGDSYKDWVKDQVIIQETYFKESFGIATDGLLKCTSKEEEITEILKEENWQDRLNLLEFSDDVSFFKFTKKEELISV
ncbi:protein phosphatase 2C domain-containing protein [Flammeovirga sp. MY04]|uniref:protein phosphatase 2C domain-containing protein n=1 Tax=Flammeovirga sp. MY04 TaxID=1191459 RepID=UPI0008062032|nr:protein phosphatase 2C domain-containing protein [Flammeovirga sp. MY04]ANQ52518.1 protein phosphatase 2C domain-containing protein [Flammeovirga sp. MY04]